MMFGRFRIDDVVDLGDVVNIYKAYDPERDRHVALEIPTETGFFARRRFNRETKPLLEIRHANIANVYETATLNGIPLLVAEFVEGPTLEEHFAEHRDTTSEILDLMAQVAAGLQAAHERGVVHRDLKPSNILITPEHEVKITDFGIAALAGSTSVSPYAAPEAALGKIDARSDVFALGAMCYELLVGPPGDATAVRERPTELLIGVPYDVRTVVGKMLEPDPQARPTAVDVARVLRGTRLPLLLGRSFARTAQYQVQFDDAASMDAALAAEGRALQPVIVSRRRNFIAIDVVSREDQRILEVLETYYGARIVEDERHALELDAEDPAYWTDENAATATLDDVLRRIRAVETREKTRGEGVVIAVVDSGVAGSRLEFPSARRAGRWNAPKDDAWQDANGHGTMVATIAAASRDYGGDFEGVAPAARIISCKVTQTTAGVTEAFNSYEVAAFDYLTELAKARPELRIVATCCWGSPTGSPPEKSPYDRFPDALSDAIEAGIVVVCSAGNYHQLAKGADDACSPCSIWLHKSRADLLTVGTCSFDEKMWFYSSRGPGQHYGEHNTNAKPDVIAPTPELGKILYGTRVLTGVKGWGTSGAAPQVAGLAALLLASDPGITRARVREVIRESADPLRLEKTCCGEGMIDCSAALQMLSRKGSSV